MDDFLDGWAEAALTSLGFFWKAAWAFALGYLVSSAIQVFLTETKIRRAMGDSEARGVAIGTGAGFISSSCSFAALSTTRTLFAKGASLPAAMAFLLASTNLVIELGLVIAMFLSWHFVVGEYVGGVLLILFVWLLIRLGRPTERIDEARAKARDDLGLSGDDDGEDAPSPTSASAWRKVGRRYGMEWAMVWKDVTVGFTVAGLIAAFVPSAFFRTLFVGSGADDPAFWQVLVQSIVGPVAAFFTFIGSMGNIPLAGLLYSEGVSFAGVMAFIFSDLVVFPVLRIQASYYGWRFSLYLAGLMLTALVATSLVLHFAFEWTGLSPAAERSTDVAASSHFSVDSTFWLNLVFALLSLAALSWGHRWFGRRSDQHGDHGHDGGYDHGEGGKSPMETILGVLAFASFGWLAIGLGLAALR